MSNKSISNKDIQWLHVPQIEEADLSFLQKNFRFHHLDYDDVRANTSLSKIDTYKHYLFFVFQVPIFKEGSRIVAKEELFIFLAEKQIVTLSQRPQKNIEDLFSRFERNSRFRSASFSKGTSYLMYLILMEAFRESRMIVTHMSDEIVRLETAISDHHEKAITVDLGHARRNVLYLRHIIDPQRNILSSLMNIKRPFIPEEVFIYFDDLRDDLDTIGITADNLKLLLDGLFDVNEALLSHRTNEVITILTVITASLMVPTLIVGFYGMNVLWLPHIDTPHFVTVLSLVAFLFMLLLMWFIVRRPRR